MAGTKRRYGSGIYRRGNVFWLKVRTPATLANHLSREFLRLSLRTTSEREALAAARIVRAALDAGFAAVEARMRTGMLTAAQAEAVIAAVARRALAGAEAVRALAGPRPEEAAEWSGFLDWADQAYPDRVLFTPQARRMARTPEFEDVAAVARAIRWLATEHYERRVAGGGSLSGAMLEPGVQNALCGGDAYHVYWHGRKYTVDWHIKNGNTRDPKRCLRIYYFWEPDEGQVVIDHLPSHRVTGAS